MFTANGFACAYPISYITSASSQPAPPTHITQFSRQVHSPSPPPSIKPKKRIPNVEVATEVARPIEAVGRARVPKNKPLAAAIYQQGNWVRLMKAEAVELVNHYIHQGLPLTERMALIDLMLSEDSGEVRPRRYYANRWNWSESRVQRFRVRLAKQCSTGEQGEPTTETPVNQKAAKTAENKRTVNQPRTVHANDVNNATNVDRSMVTTHTNTPKIVNNVEPTVNNVEPRNGEISSKSQGGEPRANQQRTNIEPVSTETEIHKQKEYNNPPTPLPKPTVEVWPPQQGGEESRKWKGREEGRKNNGYRDIPQPEHCLPTEQKVVTGATGGAATGGAAQFPTEQEVIDWGALPTVGIPPAFLRHHFAVLSAAGWEDNQAEPIRSWRRYLAELWRHRPADWRTRYEAEVAMQESMEQADSDEAIVRYKLTPRSAIMERLQTDSRYMMRHEMYKRLSDNTGWGRIPAPGLPPLPADYQRVAIALIPEGLYQRMNAGEAA